MKPALALLLVWCASAADMDSTRGAALFVSQRCADCHSMNGQGGRLGPDLGQTFAPYIPATLASTMWNHAPAMWSAMRKENSAPPPLDEQSAGDLFAYFYAAGFFERPADAARGKRAFLEKGCAGCHVAGSAALPPAQWKSVEDPVELASAMWNHAPRMFAESSLARKSWPQISSQDLSDLLIYIRTSLDRPAAPRLLRIAGTSSGEAVFQSKGCTACHGPGKLALADRLRGMNLNQIAAQMWNHAPLMKALPVAIAPEEMSQLLGYLWAQPFLEERGNVSAGRHAFSAKRCAGCHDAAGGPVIKRPAGGFNSIAMISVLWKHGPAMLNSMQAKGMEWPRFSTREMSDVVTYLNSGERK
jgi:mono/diheme cytochrome c family protein